MSAKPVASSTVSSAISPVVSNSVTQLCEQLKGRIRRGLYAPGQRLIEADLMQEFAVGRSNVRESIKTLVGEGYLSFEKNRGACVRRFTRAEAIDRARVREVLEGLTARQLAEKALDKTLRQELKDLQKGLDKSARARDFGTYSRLNAEFHEFILQHAGNSYATDILRRLSVPLFRLQFQSLFNADGFFASNEDHRKITQAILDHDPDGAEAAMKAHIHKGIVAMSMLNDDEFAQAPSE